VTASDGKDDLHGYLRGARETLVWKLEGLSEYDIRRPMTPTGTNLLGLVKHLAVTEPLRSTSSPTSSPSTARLTKPVRPTDPGSLPRHRGGAQKSSPTDG
jgi:hypothetical protein